MKIVPSVHFWSFHHQYQNCWADKFQDYIQKIIRLKQKYGFKEMGIEIGMVPGQDAFKNHEYIYLSQIGEELRQNNLKPIPTIATLNIHPEPDIVKASIDLFERGFYEASLLGADVAVFFRNIHGRLTSEKALRIYQDAMKEINSIAVKYNISCITEDYCDFTGDQLALGCRDLPNAGLLNDTGNWLILGEDPLAATKKFVDITRYLHLKDYILHDGVWQSVPLGQGYVNLKEILDFLKEYPDNRKIYTGFETDLDFGDEDSAIEKCFEFFADWQNGSLT